MRAKKRGALYKTLIVKNVVDQLEELKASMRAKVVHSLLVIKRQFGHVNMCYRGLKKNPAVQLRTLFALSNLWTARATVLVPDWQVRPKAANAS